MNEIRSEQTTVGFKLKVNKSKLVELNRDFAGVVKLPTGEKTYNIECTTVNSQSCFPCL